MAFKENLMKVSSFPVLEEDDGFHQIRNSLSRLSICTSSVYEDLPTMNRPDLGGFASESFDGAEANGEVSDEDKRGRRKDNVHESKSDKETHIYYSFPVTPSRRRRNFPVSGEVNANESNRDDSKCNLRRQKRVVIREKKKRATNGESDGGGEKSLRMGLEEVKACRDLGFELETPGRITVSTGSTLDTLTSSGGNSPIATWRISSPGDDPKEVKARLKVWAQAVALASASSQVS